ncbi:4Fe-4S binding protein [Leptolinea tardivitalis]|uniref:4Fe-4S binding protein n=1 Tax=Leptolinea tardivitalis TaxID=229920 RepID=UPI0007805213|nr:4Fe-4S binding protein [Leptolinea tardivitalis]GAP20704.1 formate hydrogenlyase subunit 6 [Leptolinea tardivitalis]
MNILQIIFKNAGKQSRTRKPVDRVPFPVDFRGELTHDALQCTLCGTCTYVCSPAAIEITRDEGDMGYWDYDAGRCTFCGRCVEYCPTKALTFLQNSAPIVSMRSLERTSHVVEYQHCTRCGATIIPIPHETLIRLYHSEEAAKKATEVHNLCEKCRNRLHSQILKSGISGSKD